MVPSCVHRVAGKPDHFSCLLDLYPSLILQGKAMPGTTLSADEVRLVKQWAIQDSEAPSEIARRLGRNKSTITRFLKKRSPPKRRGVKVAVVYALECI